MKNLTLKHIYYLSVLHKTGSFKQASKIVGLSQSAFFHNIRRLDEYLGVQLIISKRTAGSVQINPEHKWLLEKITAINDSLETIQDVSKNRTLRFNVTLSLDSGLFQSFLAPYYHEFSQKNPQISLHVSGEDDYFPLNQDFLTFNTVLITDKIDPKETNVVYKSFHAFTTDCLTNLLSPKDEEILSGLKEKSPLVIYAPFQDALQSTITPSDWEQVITIKSLGSMLSLIKNFPCTFLLSEDLARMNKIPYEKVENTQLKGTVQTYLKMNKYFARSDVGVKVTEWLLECQAKIAARLSAKS